MSLSVPYIVLLAKQREIDELKRLKARATLVGALGHMIHVLQSERGASSTYLASSGKRFEQTRLALIEESRSVEQVLRVIIEDELANSAFADARMISLIAWALLGLEALPELRQRIASRGLSGAEAVTAFSRLIAGLVSLIFEVADAAIDPDISRLLVCLFNLVEGKESAGQERAVGGLIFGSGHLDQGLQQRILHLAEAQENSFRSFLEFADEDIVTTWHAMQGSTFLAQLQRLRQLIRTTAPGQSIDSAQSDAWFECCSQRISHMWTIQRKLIDTLQALCDRQLQLAESELLNSEGLLQSLRESPPARAGAIDRFFDPDLPIEQSLHFNAEDHVNADNARSLVEILQAQSHHLATMESELASTRRALNERKLIERAKGILMARYRLSEHEAHKRLRGMSMDNNMRLVQVAESVLTLTSLDR